ncbi:hypothetical protein AB1287_17410 [Enterobacter asburiae]
MQVTAVAPTEADRVMVSQICNGGSNGDPVFRGIFDSRLNILADGGNLQGLRIAYGFAHGLYFAEEFRFSGDHFGTEDGAV